MNGKLCDTGKREGFVRLPSLFAIKINMIRQQIQLLQYVFSCQLRHKETAEYFQIPEPKSNAAPVAEISVLQRDWDELRTQGFADSAHTEYSILTPYFSEALVPYECVIIHAAALRWRDHAYLICAESGVGKSTQANWLQKLRPGAFSVICGDRPILEFRQAAESKGGVSAPASLGVAFSSIKQASTKRTDVVYVHPSPWNGKENWHGADAAPLAGLILLNRGEENCIVSLSEREAALPLYPQFIHTGWNPEMIRRIADLETRLLNAASIWRLTTHDVPASTRLLLETVFQ